MIVCVCINIYMVHIWNIWKPGSIVLFLFRWGKWYLEILQTLSDTREPVRPTALFETQVWFTSKAYVLSQKSGSEKWNTFSEMAQKAPQASAVLRTWETPCPRRHKARLPVRHRVSHLQVLVLHRPHWYFSHASRRNAPQHSSFSLITLLFISTKCITVGDSHWQPERPRVHYHRVGDLLSPG